MLCRKASNVAPSPRLARAQPLRLKRAPAQGRNRPLPSASQDNAATKANPAAPQASTPVAMEARSGAPGAAPRLSAPSTSRPASPPASSAGLLAELRTRARDANTLNVYGKPYTKTELEALDAAVSHLSSCPRGSSAAEGGAAALRWHLMAELLLEAAVSKRTPLPVVEGAMALLELLELLRQGGLPRPPAGGPAAAAAAAVNADGAAAEDSAGAPLEGDDPALFERYRWQLIVGADVGGVQYIPAVEELEVFPEASGCRFTLGTDLDFIFTGFRGPCEWLAPGHLSYTVRQVRLELRWPKAWRRAAAWLAWRRRLGDAAPTAAALGDEPDCGDSLPTSRTCREDPAAPAVTIPLPFPTNELLAFSCDGRVAATRSRLTGGLILLLEVTTRDRA